MRHQRFFLLPVLVSDADVMLGKNTASRERLILPLTPMWLEDVVPSPAGDDHPVALVNKPAADCQLISEGRILPQLCRDRVWRGWPTAYDLML